MELLKELTLCIDLLSELLELAEEEVKPFVYTPQLVQEAISDIRDRLADIESHYE